MKRGKLFLLILSICIVVSISTAFMIERSRLVQVNKIPMNVTVLSNPKQIGFCADPHIFCFGSMSPGNGGQRWLKINPKEDVIVEVKKTGEMGNWLTHENNFIVKKGEWKELTVTLTVPYEVDPGVYSGEFIVVLRKV